MKEIKTIIRDGRANKAYGAYGAYKAYGLLIALMALISLIVLTGCSKDDAAVSSAPVAEPVGRPIAQVASYVRWYDEAYGANRAHEANKVNRAWAIPSGYVAYEDGVQPIGIAFTRDGENPTIGTGTAENPKPMIGSFFKSSDKWRTNVEDIVSSATYQLYGYIPHQTAINYSITDYDGAEGPNGANGSYSTGAIMTLQNVPTVMPHDLCVVIGAKHGYDKEHDGNSDGTNRLIMGDFNYTASSDVNGNYVFLLFDHLYAALRIRMKVHADYAKLRTIKLKSLQLDTQAGDIKTTKKTTITIKLKANDGSSSPIEALTFTPTGEEIDGGLEFWSSTYGEQLTTDFKPFIGHFMPSGITKLILTSTYDVYDNNVTEEHPEGNLIRKDCKATNTMLLKDLLTDQSETERGKRYTINMTIKPTYLYMLSEPDLDNPTVKVE